MYLPVRRPILSYGIAAAGVVLAGLSHWWLAPFLGDTPPVRLLLVIVVMSSAWLGGLRPGLFATTLGLLAIVAANDAPGDLPGLTNRLVRFGLLAILITLLFKGLHASHQRAEMKEKELRDAKELAEAACQAKDRFIAVLSHELRTPLTPVLYAVSSMLESSPNSELRPTLEMIHRNIELEARLIDDLLTLSRLSRGRMRLDLEVIDIHEAIRRAIEICRDQTFVAGLDVVTKLTAPDHHVTADHARVMQIVWNLIHNAAKFTPPNGKLTIRTSNLPDQTGATLGSAPWIAVDFEDTGIGIDPAVLPRIFEAFEQYHDDVRGRSGGLGLGLAISRSLAEALGGRLVASSPGRGLGSTFRLELAAVPAECVPEPARSSAAAPAAPAVTNARSDLRILLVEDNMDTLRYLATVLRQRGHDVVTADRVATARAAVDEAKVPFDLLLSDIELPDGDGLYLMRELGAGGHMRGIAVSGFGAEEDRRQSREAGFSDHLTKPVDLNRLEAAIHRATSGASQTSG